MLHEFEREREKGWLVDWCDVASIIIPGQESILCACDVKGSLALDPPQNKS